LLFCGERAFAISFSCGDQMENDAREFVGCSRWPRGSVAGHAFFDRLHIHLLLTRSKRVKMLKVTALSYAAYFRDTN